MKKLFAILLVVALMATMSVTAFAVEETETITLALSDSYGDGWDTTSVKACLVKNGGAEEVLGAGMTVSQIEATYEFTVPKFAVVRFYWEAEEEYDDECGVTIQRGGAIQFEQVDFHGMAEGDLIFESTYAEFQSTTVTYQVAPTYVVTIPTDVTIDGNSTTISAEGVVVEKGQYVSVTLAENNDFTVKTAEGAELAYTVTANGENVAPGDELLAVNPADSATGTATITFAVDESAVKYAGTYTGSATFTIAVKDVPLINFTMDTSHIEKWVPGLTQNLQAEAGMTWGEWVESAYNVDGYGIYQFHFIDIDFVGPNADWSVSDGGYPNYISLTDEIIAGHEYCFAVTGG